MTAMLRTIATAGVLLLTMLSSAVARQQELTSKEDGTAQSKPHAMIGQEAPGFSLPGVNGDTITLSSLRGKIVLLDFWTTWCPPCREHMQIVEKVAREFKNTNTVVYLRINGKETPEQVNRFLRENSGYSFPTLLTFVDDSILNDYDLRVYPTLVIVDRSGKIADLQIGIPEGFEAKLRATLERISRADYQAPSPQTPEQTKLPGVIYPEPDPALPPVEPKSAAGFLLRASLERRLRQYPQAMNDVEASLHLRPGWTEALLVRASLHSAMRAPKDALADYTEYIRLVPGDATAYQMRADVHENLADSASAIADYTKAIDLNPKSTYYHLRRGTLYLNKMRELDKAKADFDAAIEISPAHVEAYRMRAAVLDKMDRWEDEIADLENVLLALPTDESARIKRQNLVRRIASAQRDVTGDDAYDVYSTVLLNPVWNHTDSSQLLLIQETTGTTYGSMEPSGCIKPPAEYKKAFDELLEDYQKHKDDKLELQPRFKIPRAYKLLTREDAKEFVNSRFTGFNGDKKPAAPSEKNALLFNQSPDIIRLGRVFFDQNHTTAMVLVSNWCGGLCGGQKWRILQKRRGSWVDVEWNSCVIIS